MEESSSSMNAQAQNAIGRIEDLFTKGSVERRIAEDIIRSLVTLRVLVPEPDVMKLVSGKRTTKVNVFRELVEAQIIHRTGEGRRKAPFRYCINLKTAAPLKTSTQGDAGKGRSATNVQSKARSKKMDNLVHLPGVAKGDQITPERKFSDHELKEFAAFYQILLNSSMKVPVSK